MKIIDEVLLQRRSYRNFEKVSIEQEELKKIIALAQRSANSINGQQTSIIALNKQSDLDLIAELTNMPWINKSAYFLIVAMDFYKANYALSLSNQKQEAINEMELTLVGAVDSGIMISALDLLFQSRNYGTTIVGAIRGASGKIIKAFSLPEYTFPIVGLAIGKKSIEEKAQVKPRLSVESYLHFDRYNKKQVEDEIINYDKILKQWFLAQNVLNQDYILKLSIYNKRYYLDLFDHLQTQKFLLDYKNIKKETK